MNFKKPMLIGLLTLLWTILSHSHPTSFKGSVGVMGYHANLLTHNQLNYSFKHWYAMGVHHIRRPQLQSANHATLLSSNFLVKRWNGSSYQANLYGVLGGGISELSGKSEGVGMGLVQFDIEDRKYYFLAKHMEMFNENEVELSQSVVRFGIAPYQGGFNDLHTWIIVEWQRNLFLGGRPIKDVTPFLRFFYQNILFEFGQSYRGVTRFNYISHF